ncbi:hypothetical protein SAMN05443667_101437 [Flavobacterium gillisiae]|uniref:Uncharacterized protein n=1 Tax=Flavobacterium gillisiae TaxID=150146 RepID=A0A1H3X9P3_9FLAO|nr:hypothetical protein [Flavobacterium gillisiae]SDZ96116.1 hypothetical protein SAMN05443667_101437 [Flavobacterium gillisiae]
MKNFSIKLVWFTTVFVFIFAALSQTNITVLLLLSLLIFGELLILFIVYRVLTDKYTTTKMFKDWYEDHPMDALDH